MAKARVLKRFELSQEAADRLEERAATCGMSQTAFVQDLIMCGWIQPVDSTMEPGARSNGSTGGRTAAQPNVGPVYNPETGEYVLTETSTGNAAAQPDERRCSWIWARDFGTLAEWRVGCYLSSGHSDEHYAPGLENESAGEWISPTPKRVALPMLKQTVLVTGGNPESSSLSGEAKGAKGKKRDPSQVIAQAQAANAEIAHKTEIEPEMPEEIKFPKPLERGKVAPIPHRLLACPQHQRDESR